MEGGDRKVTMKSIVIIGGGVIGLCTAYYAARKGHRVTLIERGQANHDGCSLGNAGMIVPSHFVPLAAPGMVALGLRMMFDPESPFHIRPRASLKLAPMTAGTSRLLNKPSFSEKCLDRLFTSSTIWSPAA